MDYERSNDHDFLVITSSAPYNSEYTHNSQKGDCGDVGFSTSEVTSHICILFVSVVLMPTFQCCFTGMP